MTTRDRARARVALAMLTVGAAMALLSVIASIIILVLIFATLIQRPAAAALLLVWCAAALIVAGANAVKSIEVMSAIDWRALIPAALRSSAIVATYPGWWM